MAVKIAAKCYRVKKQKKRKKKELSQARHDMLHKLMLLF